MRDQGANSVIENHHTRLSKKLCADDLSTLVEVFGLLAQLGRENAKEVRLERAQKMNEKPSGRNSDGKGENAK